MYDLLTLDNGVRIVSEPMPYASSVSIGVWVGAGSRFEKHGEEGTAHFIEHMLFKGTDSRTAKDLAMEMDAIGGQINAFTTRDSTCFYARVLDKHFKLASDILSDMFFHSLFSESDVESERNVVFDEIDMYKDTPEDLVGEQLMLKTFPGPLGKPVLGKCSSLSAMTGDSLKNFMKREYTPDRVVIAAAGRFKESDISYLARQFSQMPLTKPCHPRTAVYKPAIVCRKKVTEQNQFILAWEGLTDSSEDRFTLQLFSALFGGGVSSRLFQNIREKYGLCYSIGTFTSSYADTGLFGISTAVNKDSEIRALSLIAGEIKDFLDHGVTEEELIRAKELINASMLMSLESTSSRMNRLGSAILQLGTCLPIEEVSRRYNSITSDDILSLAQKIMKEEKLSFSALGRLRAADEYSSCLHY